MLALLVPMWGKWHQAQTIKWMMSFSSLCLYLWSQFENTENVPCMLGIYIWESGPFLGLCKSLWKALLSLFGNNGNCLAATVYIACLLDFFIRESEPFFSLCKLLWTNHCLKIMEMTFLQQLLFMFFFLSWIGTQYLKNSS